MCNSKVDKVSKSKTKNHIKKVKKNFLLMVQI